MATATSKRTVTSVVLELSTDEAESLYALIEGERDKASGYDIIRVRKALYRVLYGNEDRAEEVKYQ